MNIFFLDKKPRQCAEYHCDKHVVKMILETAQLLCSVHWMSGAEAPYKLTHKNHPSAIWARENIKHYRWLSRLGYWLCIEYSKRYAKQHKTQAIIEWCMDNLPDIPVMKWSDPPQAMPDHCKSDDTVSAYRLYYKTEKSSFATWKTEIPEWYDRKAKNRKECA